MRPLQANSGDGENGRLPAVQAMRKAIEGGNKMNKENEAVFQIEQAQIEALKEMDAGKWGNSKTVQDLRTKGYHFSDRDLGTMRRIYNLEPDIFTMRRARIKGDRGARNKFFISFKGYEDLAIEEIRNRTCADRICVTDGTICGLMATEYCPDSEKAKKELRRIGYVNE